MDEIHKQEALNKYRIAASFVKAIADGDRLQECFDKTDPVTAAAIDLSNFIITDVHDLLKEDRISHAVAIVLLDQYVNGVRRIDSIS